MIVNRLNSFSRSLVSNVYLTRQSQAIRGFATASADSSAPEASKIDWNQLGFSYVPTKEALIVKYKDGKWQTDKIERTGPYINVHLLSNVINYGQTLFEGLKAFHQKDGKVVLFYPEQNAARMNRGAARLGMPEIPEEMFIKMCSEAVKSNVDYVPPYGTGGSLYLRPVYFGSGAQLGLGRAKEYVFGVVTSPVGLYYKSGLKPLDAKVIEDFDRAAPRGIGAAKTAGNYAADIVPAEKVTKEGYGIALYLDAEKKKYVEEFSTSNFIGIDAAKKEYVTPKSPSILKSITNLALQDLARSHGMTVKEENISFEDIESGRFSEIGAVGTAVIITPIKSLRKGQVTVTVGSGSFPILNKLYEELRSIQCGDEEDHRGWCKAVCDKPLN